MAISRRSSSNTMCTAAVQAICTVTTVKVSCRWVLLVRRLKASKVMPHATAQSMRLVCAADPQYTP